MKRLKDFINVKAVLNNYNEAQAKLQEMTESGRLRFFEKGMKLNGEIGGMMVKTSPFPPWMEYQRVDAAVGVVRQIYGSVDAYKGIWIASGCLDEGVAPENQQRQMLVDRLKQSGVRAERIRETGGENTFGDILMSSSVVNGMEGNILGVPSFYSHLQRFALDFDYLIESGKLRQDISMLGIVTPYKDWKFSWKAKRGFGLADELAIAGEWKEIKEYRADRARSSN